MEYLFYIPQLELGHIWRERENLAHDYRVLYAQGNLVLRYRAGDFMEFGVQGYLQWARDLSHRTLRYGGNFEIVEMLTPLFQSLSPSRDSVALTPGDNDSLGTAELGYLYCGESGAGHFTKMIHNGIEYGMMAAYAEGFEMLNTTGNLDNDISNNSTMPKLEANVAQISELWRRGSVVNSWLLDLAAMNFRKDPELKSYSGHVSDSGEGRWVVETAAKLGVPA